MQTNYRIIEQGNEFEVQSWRDVLGATTWYSHEGVAPDEATAKKAVELFEAGQAKEAYALLALWEDES